MTGASAEAAREDKTVQRERVYEAISGCHPWGTHNEALAWQLGLSKERISARIVELRETGRVKYGWDTIVIGKDGKHRPQSVWVLGDDSELVKAERRARDRRAARRLPSEDLWQILERRERYGEDVA